MYIWFRKFVVFFIETEIWLGYAVVRFASAYQTYRDFKRKLADAVDSLTETNIQRDRSCDRIRVKNCSVLEIKHKW